MKSKRWYIFWHIIILAVVNAWLMYRRDCRALHIPKKETLSRRRFQAPVASVLIMVNTVKRGRPSLSEVSPPAYSQPTKKSRTGPPLDVRRDNVGHWPIKFEKRGRCKNCVDGYTTAACNKCDVRLCFTEQNNCFLQYHSYISNVKKDSSALLDKML
ncbi:UNVERIFIED_CONTAM: hypothetical protein FKN15_065240 [Acipenser sinensis]